MSSVSIFREGADSGDWCSILLPIAIFISNYKREVPISDVYNYQGNVVKKSGLRFFKIEPKSIEHEFSCLVLNGTDYHTKFLG